MSPDRTEVPRVVRFADRLEDDIRAKGLRPGDPYLTTAEAASELHISTSTANAALRVLQQRGILLRRQRTGSVIAAMPYERRASSSIERVYLVVPEATARGEGLFCKGLLVGLHGALPGTEFVRWNLPVDDVEGGLGALFGQVDASSLSAGFVLARAPLSAQRLLAASRRPAALFGSSFDSIDELSTLDRDHAAIGSLLTAHLIRQGSERLLLLLRNEQLPGDHDFLDGVLSALAAAGRAADSLTLRCLPSDPASISAAVDAAVREGPPPGILARSEPLLAGAEHAVAKSRLRAGRDIHLAVADLYGAQTSAITGVAYARPTESPEKVGARLGRLLVEDPSAPPRHERIGVEVVSPS